MRFSEMILFNSVLSKKEKMSQVEMSQVEMLPVEMLQFDVVFNKAEYHDNFWTTKNQAFKDGHFDTEQDFCQKKFEKDDCIHCGYIYTKQSVKPCEVYIGPLEKQCCLSSCSPTVTYDSITVDITTPETVCVGSLLAAILVLLFFILGKALIQLHKKRNFS